MMMGDFYQIIDRLNEFVEIKPIPYAEYVENYIIIWTKSAQEITDFVIKNKVN